MEYRIFDDYSEVESLLKEELVHAEFDLNKFRRDNLQQIEDTDEKFVKSIGEQFYIAAAYISARFSTDTTDWGIAEPYATAVYGLFLARAEDPYDAIRKIYIYSRKPRVFNREPHDKFPYKELQESIIDRIDSRKRTPLDASEYVLCVNRHYGNELLSFCFPDLPPSRMTFLLKERDRWYNPLDEEVSLFHHCLLYNYPDVVEAYQDMGATPEKMEEYRHDERFLAAFQVVLKKPVMTSIKMEVKDMMAGNRDSRRNLLKMFQDKESVANLWSNLAMPAIVQKDVPIQNVQSQYHQFIAAPDPTAADAGTPLVYDPNKGVSVVGNVASGDSSGL